MEFFILEALFHGRIAPWARKLHLTKDYRELKAKIDQEVAYFAEKMSPEDRQRFDDLADLYPGILTCEEIDVYTHGFRLGARLMLEILRDTPSLFVD